MQIYSRILAGIQKKIILCIGLIIVGALLITSLGIRGYKLNKSSEWGGGGCMPKYDTLMADGGGG